MRFYAKQHNYYCGIDLHARTMYGCILDSKAQHAFRNKDRFFDVLKNKREKYFFPMRDFFAY